MLPTIWGHCAWNFIHLVAVAYPENPSENDKINYYNFFHSLQFILPCKKCRSNMSQHLSKFPLTEEALSSRSNLVKWTIDFHNIVNYYTGKKRLTYSQAMDEINKLFSPKKSKNKFILYLLLVIIIIIIIYVVYRYKKKLNY